MAANSCCAALQLRCSKLEEKRNALRQGCHILKDELSRLEADNGALKKAYDEERAHADHEKNLKEKETAFKISLESKVAELESQLFSVQQAGSSQFEDLDKQLLILRGKVSQREADVERIKQLLEEETRKTDVEREHAIMERQRVMELYEALEAQKNRAKETCTCNTAEVIDDSEPNKATLLQYKERADENERKVTEERSYANNLLKNLEGETVKVERLQKDMQALKSFRESDEARFSMELSEKEAELSHFRDAFEVEKSRADVEQKKVATLQATLELQNKSHESSNQAQDEAKKEKYGLLAMERLKNEVEKLTLEQSRYEDMVKKYETEKKKVLKEMQRAEKAKAVELKKLTEENDKRVMEEKTNSERLLQQVKEEREKVETLKKQVQELLSFDKSNASAHSDYLELKKAYSELEAENKKLVKEKKHMDRVKAQELKRLTEEKDKKVMEERSNSKKLAQQMESERQKVEMLQNQVQELLSSAKSAANDHSTYLELNKAYARLEAQNKMLIREKKSIEAEMGKLDDLRKLSAANEKKYFEERGRADCSSHELERSKQKIKKLEEELHSLKLKLKLEKKRLKHAKQVLKFEEDRNSVLQHELGKLKQYFIQTVQHLDIMEHTFCRGTQGMDNSTKSRDVSKLQSLYLNKLLFGSNQFETLEDGPLSSSRREGSAIPIAVYTQPGNSTESPSGITTKLQPLVGGGVREISPSSLMDSSAASFPDKLLPESQEGCADALATSTIVVDRNPNLQAKILKHSDQVGNKKNSAHVVPVVDNRTQTPLDSLCAHSKKSWKLLHEFESLKNTQSESRKLHQELEKKPSRLHSKLNRLTPRQAEVLLPDRVASQLDGPRKKQKTSHNLEETINPSHYSAPQIKRDMLLAPTPLPAINECGSVQACSDQDSLLVFAQRFQGNVMRLLELDNEVDEDLFRNAIENPLSPTLPKIKFENFGLVGIDSSGGVVDKSYHRCLLTGKESVISGAPDVEKNSKSKVCDPGSCSISLGSNNYAVLERNKENGTSIVHVGDGTRISGNPVSAPPIKSIPVSTSDCAKQTDKCKSGNTFDTVPLFCILFSHMEDINRIRMLLFATKRCLKQCSLHSQTDRMLMELLTALASEQQLTTRDKVCVFFTLIMYNFLQVSSNESEVYFNQGSLSSFPSHLCSVLSDAEKSGILAKSFCYSDFLRLFEDFISCRRILFVGDKYTDANNFTPRLDILLEGKKVVLYAKTASTHEMFAGSVIFSSICSAFGQISVLCDVSFNVLQMLSADPQLILYILHGFALVSGGKYFMTGNYSIQMEVVKSMVNVLENARDVQGATLMQSDRKASHQFPVCAKCPFAKSLQPLHILSMLVEELGKYASMPTDSVDSFSSLSEPGYASNKDIYAYIDIMSSVELITIIMGWSWTTDKILPELQKLVPSTFTGKFSTSLVLLLGRIGRFGVKSCGYEDAGVNSIRQHLSSLLVHIPSLEQNHIVTSALFSALDSLQSKESTQNITSDLSASSTFIRKCSSSLSSEKKCLISALKQPTS